MRHQLLFLLLLLLSSTAFAQSKYWQQKVDTKLEVMLDDRNHFLRGFESMLYTNNSPDTLFYLYLHLYPNAYSSDLTAFTTQQVLHGKTDFYFSKAKDQGFIDSLKFTINGDPVFYTTTETAPDIARIDLIHPIAPGEGVTIETPFRVKIPKVYSRLGHEKQAYYISQWFPKPAVYDARGWHAMPYLDQGEFYSEIGSYDVSITLPKNYVVMATGNLMDVEEINWLDSLAAIPEELKLSAFQKLKPGSWDSIPPSDFVMKTIRFSEDNIHDFVFFADKRYLVEKDTFTLKETGKTVAAWAASLPGSYKYWKDNVNSWQRKTVEYLSSHVGSYPYKTIKMVEGDMKAGGGMEYPTIAVIDGSISSSKYALRVTVVHEAGHNWFQGLLATNERDHVWMDEGVNSFYERCIIAEMDSTDWSEGYEGYDNLYLQAAKGGTDQPIATSSAAFTETNYGIDAYIKPALMLRWLQVAVGEAAFEMAMKKYFHTWHHKHPYPEDLQDIFKRQGLESDWFFQEALNNMKPVDFGMKKSKPFKKRNTAWPMAPILTENLYKSQKGTRKDSDTANMKLDAIRLNENIPDANLTNNLWQAHGLSPHGGARLGFGFGIGTNYKKQIFLLPALGYNVYDGFMAGMVVHNLSIPENKFRFALAPLYGFGSNTIVGAGSIGLFFHPYNAFQEVAVQVDGKTFNYQKTDYNTPNTLYSRFVKIAPSIHFTLRKPFEISTVERNLLVKGFAIREQAYDYRKALAPDSLFRPYPVEESNVYGLLRYQHSNNRTFNPFSYTGEIQAGQAFIKLSMEGNLRIDYHAKNKGLAIRVFAGKFISLDDKKSYRYQLNTTHSGTWDYLYEDTYLGRNETEGIAAQQVAIREGGLKLATPYYVNPLGRTDNWLAAINLKTDLPFGRVPLRLYLDIATFDDAKTRNPSGNKFLYQGGLELELFKAISIQLPLVLSSDYTDYLKSVHGDKAFSKRITFTLHFEKLNVLQAVGKVLRYL